MVQKPVTKKKMRREKKLHSTKLFSCILFNFMFFFTLLDPAFFNVNASWWNTLYTAALFFHFASYPDHTLLLCGVVTATCLDPCKMDLLVFYLSPTNVTILPRKLQYARSEWNAERQDRIRYTNLFEIHFHFFFRYWEEDKMIDIVAQVPQLPHKFRSYLISSTLNKYC